MKDSDPYSVEKLLKILRNLETKELDIIYFTVKGILEMIADGKKLDWFEKKAMESQKLIDEIRQERLIRS